MKKLLFAGFILTMISCQTKKTNEQNALLAKADSIYKSAKLKLANDGTYPIDDEKLDAKFRAKAQIDKEMEFALQFDSVIRANGNVYEFFKIEQPKILKQKTLNSQNVDSSKIKELMKYFDIKKDEFSTTKKIWYKCKTIPKYTNSNGIYIYFMSENGITQNLRFRLQYSAESWLFIQSIQFSIDDNAFEYTPNKVEHDNDSNIWEWFDDEIQINNQLINTLSNAKKAKMKLIGKQYHDIKIISPIQIQSIKRTLELYKAMGGK